MSDYHHDALNMYRKRNIRLMDENRALRELVRKMWRDLHAHGYEATTVLNARYSDSIRELGIEVDL